MQAGAVWESMQPRTDQVRQPGTYVDMGITSRRIYPDHESYYTLHNAEGSSSWKGLNGSYAT